MMKKNILFIIATLTAISFIGCATQTVTIKAVPEDSKIYVDGEYLGKGEGTFNAGLEYSYPQSHEVQITHLEYEGFSTTIKNKLDVKVGATYFGVMLGIGALDLILHYIMYDPVYSPSKALLYIGIVTIAISPIEFLLSNKFKDEYSYDLTD